MRTNKKRANALLWELWAQFLQKFIPKLKTFYPNKYTGWNPALRLNINNIGPAMKELGFPRMRFDNEYGYLVSRYNEMEKCEQKWAKGASAKAENETDNDSGDTIY